MKIFIIVIFLFSVVRSLIPLTESKNYNIGSVTNAITMVVAYVYLLTLLIEIKQL